MPRARPTAATTERLVAKLFPFVRLGVVTRFIRGACPRKGAYLYLVVWRQDSWASLELFRLSNVYRANRGVERILS